MVVTALLLATAQAATAQAASAPAATDPAGLAALLAKGGGQAVVALADARPIAVDPSATAETFSTALKPGHVRYLPGPVAIAHSETLPEAAIETIARLRAVEGVGKATAAAIPKDAVIGGKITFTSAAGTVVDLNALQTLPFSQPLRLAPAYINALAASGLAVSVKDLDESEFLRSVAKAIGGRFRSDGKNLIIEPSGVELRNRAIKTIDLAAKSPRKDGETAMNLSDSGEGEMPVARPQRGGPRGGGRGTIRTNERTLSAQLALARAVTNAVTPLNFERLLDGQVESVSVDLTDQAAQRALVSLLRANATEPPDLARVNRLLSSVPPRAPGVVVLGEGYSLDATLNTVDARGNPGRTVRLKVL